MKKTTSINAYNNHPTNVNKRRLDSTMNTEMNSPPIKKRKLNHVHEITTKMSNLISHVKKELIKCTQCAKTFKSKRGLNTHFGMMHTNARDREKRNQ